MLITESQLGTGVARSGMSLLESMSYLTEEESKFHAAMVPVVENARIGANVVALEDIMKFAESNGIEDLGIALNAVCEASDIAANTVMFSVQETSVIADRATAGLVKDIMAEGVAIAAVPLSANHPASVLAEAAMDELFETGSHALLEAYINDSFGAFAEAAKKAAAPVAQKAAKAAVAPAAAPAAEDQVKSTETMLEKIKKTAIDKPRDWVAAKIAALNAKMRDVINAANAADPEKKSIFLKIKAMLAKAIEFLTRHMNNLMKKVGAKDEKGQEVQKLEAMPKAQ
jgi:hypothetical protein|nr:MAG TPA: hypothetical protein [Caudoviricetes sp.]